MQRKSALGLLVLVPDALWLVINDHDKRGCFWCICRAVHAEFRSTASPKPNKFTWLCCTQKGEGGRRAARAMHVYDNVELYVTTGRHLKKALGFHCHCNGRAHQSPIGLKSGFIGSGVVILPYRITTPDPINPVYRITTGTTQVPGYGITVRVVLVLEPRNYNTYLYMWPQKPKAKSESCTNHVPVNPVIAISLYVVLCRMIGEC
jgi:hypothetical protein